MVHYTCILEAQIMLAYIFTMTQSLKLWNGYRSDVASVLRRIENCIMISLLP